MGYKFTLTGINVTTNCLGTVDTNRSRITSPNYPQNYNNYDNCYWFLWSEEDISLEFEFFSTESCCDFVRMYNENSTLIGSYKGELSREITSKIVVDVSANLIKIAFTSDGHFTNPGFSL